METFDYRQHAGITALHARMSDFQYTKHCHAEYAIGVTLRGAQRFHLDAALLSSHPGGVMLFAPGQVHDGSSLEETELAYGMLYLEAGLFTELTGRNGDAPFASPVVYDRGLARAARGAIDAVFSGAQDALISEHLLALADHLPGTRKLTLAPGRNPLVDRAMEMIACELDTERVLRLNDICREIDVPKYTLIRMFEASAGISPYQFYLNSKVEKAKRLLLRSRDVYQAVAACGFVDLSHMNRHFKSRYGVTAGAYLSGIR